MGRTRTKTRKADAVAASSSKPAAEEPSIDALLEKAAALLVQTDYALSARFLDRVLRLAPHHAGALELLGALQLETGDLESARATFASLLPPSPHAPDEPPPAAHLYLAQLDEDPRGALGHYDAAVNILEEKLKSGGVAGEEEAETRATIVCALVASVEVWMDPSHDLCFEPGAENTCEALLGRALATVPGNAEALQALASVRLSQERPEDAKVLLEQAWGAWKDLDLDDPAVPPHPTRLALAKLLLELALYAPALAVVQGVLAGDDSDPEAWYLLGWAHFLRAESLHPAGAWEDDARAARDALEGCLQLECEDEPMVEHARELVARLEAMGVGPAEESEGEEGEGEDDEGEWEDESDVEMA